MLEFTVRRCPNVRLKPHVCDFFLDKEKLLSLSLARQTISFVFVCMLTYFLFLKNNNFRLYFRTQLEREKQCFAFFSSRLLIDYFSVNYLAI